MSEDLITKYRPRTWDDFIGNDAEVQSLMNAVDKGIAHSFLLIGESGMGKTTAARLLAKDFGDSNPFEFDAATNTSVDDTRPIIESLRYKAPLSGSKKVFIMDECHRLSQAAWDSLLKSIEEPPPYAYWVLCTTNPKKVPGTIVTRCVKTHFKKVSNDDLYYIIDKVAKAEKFDAPISVLEACVKYANGSPRQALANLAACWNIKDIEEALTVLEGVGEDADAIDLIKALLANEPWANLVAIFNKLKDKDSESVRHVMLAYLTKVSLSTKSDEASMKIIRYMNIFASACTNHGLADIILACGMAKFQ